MRTIRLLHPGSRMVRFVKPDMLERSAFKGYVRAPWDCVCPEWTPCRCDHRPQLPEPDRADEAVADLRARVARFIEAGLVAWEDLGAEKPRRGKT